MPDAPAPVMTADDLHRFLGTAFPDAGANPFGVEEITATGVTMRLPVGPHHQRPGGTVSGPTMMTLADTAAYMATLSRIGPVALAVTSSLTIHFLLKPPLDADLLAEATLLRLGRRLSVTDVRIVTEGTGDVVACSTVTYAIPAS